MYVHQCVCPYTYVCRNGCVLAGMSEGVRSKWIFGKLAAVEAASYAAPLIARYAQWFRFLDAQWTQQNKKIKKNTQIQKKIDFIVFISKFDLFHK